MGEETGRKSALRHVKAIVLAVILAISLAPAVALRFFPREASVLMLEPAWNILGPITGLPRNSLVAIWIIVSFVLAIVIASALFLVFTVELARYSRESG